MSSKASRKLYDVVEIVLADVRALSRFSKAHMVSRVLWDSWPHALRARFIAQEYVRVEMQRVILTEYGLEVIGYREATA